MLPKSQRLNLKTDFKWVAEGKKIETNFVKLFIKMADNTAPRIGIALSGKYFKKAILRNKARRIVSSAFESLYPSLPSAINIIALPKTGIVKVKSQDVVLDLEAVFKNEKILD